MQFSLTGHVSLRVTRQDNNNISNHQIWIINHLKDATTKEYNIVVIYLYDFWITQNHTIM